MRESSEVLFTNARVITGEPGAARADWLLVVDGLVADLGVGAAPRPGHGTEVRDLAGRTMLPGLVDGHTHLALGGARGLSDAEIPAHVATVDALAEFLRGEAAALAEGAWLVAGPVPSVLFHALDSRDALAMLDAATGSTPVLLRDETLHNRAVNTAALGRIGDLGFSGAGRVSREEGRPTGVLWEQASLLGERAAAADRPADSERSALAAAMRRYNGFGVTTVQDAATSLGVYETLREMEQDGEATLRTVVSLLFNDPGLGIEPTGPQLLDATGVGGTTELVRRSFAKIFLDGVPSSRTAAYHVPYPGAAEHPNGVLHMTEDQLVAALGLLGEHGLGAKIHVLGDRAVSVAFAATVRARAQGFSGPVQLAHAKNIAPHEISGLRELDISIDASPPVWHPSSITQAIVRELGEEIAYRRSPHRAMIDAGAVLAGGSDWPVVASPSPWYGIESMVTRADPSGRFPGVLWPEQAIRVEEALAAHTSWAAEALGIAHLTGRLAPGLSADLAVLDRDPFAVDPRELHRTRALETFLAGRCVHSAAATA